MLLSQFEHIPSMEEQQARHAALRKRFYPPVKKPAPEIKPVVKALPKKPKMDWTPWRLGVRFAFENLHHRIADGRFIPPVNPRKPISDILIEVARKHSVEINDIKKVDGYASRKRRIVFARQEVFWRCCNETDKSLPYIGMFLGGFDHTTVLHGRKAYARRMEGGEA